MSQILNITEIFLSIQGEAMMTGLPSLFIRLSGCNIRCRYCDTAYAFARGRQISISEVMERVPQDPHFHVTITGGEPLMQAGTPVLAHALLERNAQVLVFTNGTQNIGKLPKKTIKIMDIKSPWCETEPPTEYTEYVKTPFLDYQNLPLLTRYDQVKFVIRNHAEFLWSLAFMENNKLNIGPGNIIFSPEASAMNPGQLGKWILDSGQQIRLGMQIHRFLGLDPKADR